MYKLTVTQWEKYREEITYIFDDFNDLVTFMEVSLKRSEHPVKITVELTKKEGESDEI